MSTKLGVLIINVFPMAKSNVGQVARMFGKAVAL